jgi:hypothetical protein
LNLKSTWVEKRERVLGKDMDGQFLIYTGKEDMTVQGVKVVNFLRAGEVLG